MRCYSAVMHKLSFRVSRVAFIQLTCIVTWAELFQEQISAKVHHTSPYTIVLNHIQSVPYRYKVVVQTKVFPSSWSAVSIVSDIMTDKFTLSRNKCSHSLCRWWFPSVYLDSVNHYTSILNSVSRIYGIISSYVDVRLGIIYSYDRFTIAQRTPYSSTIAFS